MIMKKYLIVAIAALLITGCSKEFFNRPPEDAVTVGNFYQTTAQVQASTNALYAAPWFGWNSKVGWSITELASGNGRTYSSDVAAFGDFSVSNGNFELSAAWNSLFTVVTQANGLLNNLPGSVTAAVDTSIVHNALGEAHLMRGLAYFYLVRVFGNVPIITDPLAMISSYQTVNTNPVTDVYTFIVNDLKFAEANCSNGGNKVPGHVSSGSASALLSKVYLYMQDYTNARKEAEKVINSGEFGLLGVDVPGNFDDLFMIANNNNQESIIALQWLANGGYGFGNAVQASFAFSSVITQTGDGYGVLAPTFDLQDAYAQNPGDKRQHATLMLPGDFYPELDKAAGGYTLPITANSQGTHTQIKKYVVGSPADNAGKSAFQSTGMNTYMLRYSDVLLIEAEAILGASAGVTPGQALDTAASTTDATALKYFNMVRERAGLNDLPKISFRDIIKERRLEFAIEGDYWFDLTRIDGFNSSTHPAAIAIISAQDRGTSDNSTPPVRYGNGYIVPKNTDFLFPYPATEVASDPKLTDPPVAYVFH
jgi:starch-binding outer membrane protein, SusD/RagB family